MLFNVIFTLFQSLTFFLIATIFWFGTCGLPDYRPPVDKTASQEFGGRAAGGVLCSETIQLPEPEAGKRPRAPRHTPFRFPCCEFNW